MKIWKPIVLSLLLASCASIDAMKRTVVSKGAEISDQALTDAEWWICRGSPVGTVKDRYEQSVERADLYRAFCKGSGTANVVAP